MKNEINKHISKSIAFTIAPFLIPLIWLIPDNIINSFAKGVIISLLLSIDVYFVLIFSKKDAIAVCEYKQQEFSKKKYKISQLILNRLSNCEKIKGEFIKDETYKVHYDYHDNILLYNPHRYLERVCEEIKSLISDITNIELEYISVSFIYQYPKYSDEWTEWQWITGKDATSNLKLSELIKQKDSYYHFLISNDIVTSFENDKSKLIPKHYYRGDKDTRHNTYGSISSHKMSFINNNDIFCSGYLTISTYGKKLYSAEEDIFSSENEFEQILFDSVIPPFRKIIETELGFLYMRHKYRLDIEKTNKN